MSLSGSVISDRRAHDRHPIRTEVTLLLANQQVIRGSSLDIGEGGAGVVCDVNLPIGSALTIRMQLPTQPAGNVPFEAQAVVANSILAPRDGGFRIGMSFKALSPAAKAALAGMK